MLLKLALLGSALAVLGEAENDYTVQGLFRLINTIYFFRLSSELANGIAILRRSKKKSSSKSSIRYKKTQIESIPKLRSLTVGTWTSAFKHSIPKESSCSQTTGKKTDFIRFRQKAIQAETFKYASTTDTRVFKQRYFYSFF